MAVAIAVAVADSVLGPPRNASALPSHRPSSCPARTGEATLTKTSSGWRIELDATGLPRLEGGRFYQAWLRNAGGVLVPIGTFNEGREVTLWAGVSPRSFTTLTVTREQADGDQASSGEKVLVGTVDPASQAWRAAASAITPQAATLDSAHDLLPGAVEAAHHRPLADAQGARRFLVGEAGDVDGDEDVAEIARKRGDRRVELAGLERGLRLDRPRVGDDVELVG